MDITKLTVKGQIMPIFIEFRCEEAVNGFILNKHIWINQKTFSEEEIAVRSQHQLIVIHLFYVRVMEDFLE